MGLCSSKTDATIVEKAPAKLQRSITTRVLKPLKTSIDSSGFAKGDSSDTSLKEYKKRTIPKSLKKLVWDTWIGPSEGQALCKCCENQEIRQIDFHCGHILAERHGGTNTVENLWPICSQCNLSMGTMNLYEFKNTYFSKQN